MSTNRRLPYLVIGLVCAALWPFVLRYNQSLAIVGAACLALVLVVCQMVGKHFAGESRRFSFSISTLLGLTSWVAIGMVGLPLLVHLIFLIMGRDTPIEWSTPLLLAGAIGGTAGYLHRKFVAITHVR